MVNESPCGLPLISPVFANLAVSCSTPSINKDLDDIVESVKNIKVF